MEQESTYKKIAVIGAGAAGGLAAILLAKNPYNKVVLFDEKMPFSTLLPTGGGRCNITYDENDVKEFVKNYPRGDKFLISVFSRFGVEKTRELFKDLGIKTYVQDDRRVFPVSNSSSDVVKRLNAHLCSSDIEIKKENAVSLEKSVDKFNVKTKNGIYSFDKVVIATGGKNKGLEIVKALGHKIIEPRPALTSLNILEKDFYKLSGLSFHNILVNAEFGKNKYFAQGDFLFTHKSISGPVIFKISSLSAYDEFSCDNPMEIRVCFSEVQREIIEQELKSNSKKSIKNIFAKFVPESFVSVIFEIYGIDGTKQAAQIKKSEKEVLFNSIFNLKLNVIERIKNSEIVTAGGVDLNEINSKTMESKIVKGLYIIGEMLNIDGYTGGFNLQNCWSTAYIAGISI